MATLPTTAIEANPTVSAPTFSDRLIDAIRRPGALARLDALFDAASRPPINLAYPWDEVAVDRVVADLDSFAMVEAPDHTAEDERWWAAETATMPTAAEVAAEEAWDLEMARLDYATTWEEFEMFARGW